MNTEQSYDAQSSSAKLRLPTEQTAISVPPIALTVSVGDQFHELFWALVHARDIVLERIVLEFDPNDLKGHVASMSDLRHIDDLFAGLCLGLNQNASQCKDGGTVDFVRNYAKISEQEEVARWEKKVQNHPNLKKQS